MPTNCGPNTLNKGDGSQVKHLILENGVRLPAYKFVTQRHFNSRLLTSEYTDHSILHKLLQTPDPAAHRRFVKRISFMTSVDCCLNMQPGWIWYDMQWDVPHTVS
jgi:hypothetical protein